MIKPLLKLKSNLQMRFSVSQQSLREARQLAQTETITDPRERYDALYAYLASKAQQYGFEIYNKNLMWMDEPEFWDVWKTSPFYQKQRPDRKFVLWSLARTSRSLPGDTAECGVLNGASSYLICAAREGYTTGMHHAFDSFEGLSQPQAEDTPDSPLAFEWAAGDLCVPQQEAIDNLGRFDTIRFYKGWIPSQFPEVSDARFSLVHIDVDLYQPTKDALEFFYPRLVPGGILLCDDYGYHTCPGARKAFDEFASGTSERSVIHLPTGQGLIVKRNQTA